MDKEINNKLDNNQDDKELNINSDDNLIDEQNLKDKEHKHKSKELKKLEEQIKELTEKYEKLCVEKEEWYNSFLRKAADFDNYRKRITKEIENLKYTANKELLLKIIPIFDNFKRAIDSTEKFNDYKVLIDGLKITYSELNKIFEDLGLKPIECVGKIYDPNLHEVISFEERDDIENDNIIIEEIERGYYLGDSVLKHSKVKVAKKKNKQN